MKHKTLVRILLKILGVFLFTEALNSLISSGLWLLNDLMDPTSATSTLWYFRLSGLIQGLLKTFLAIYLFFGGTWVVNKIIPSNRPYCPECGYELTGLVRNRCPECGTPLSEDLLASSRSAGGADGAC